MFKKVFLIYFLIGFSLTASLAILPVRAITSSPVITILTLDGEAPGDLFGSWVSTLGDVNNDGYDDFAVTASSSDAGGSNSGRAYIYLGGPGLDIVPDLIFTGPAPGSRINTAAQVGDVNDDGIDDFIIGARGEYRYHTGKTYLFYGSPTLDAVPDLVFTAEQVGDAFGASLSGLGDVNADGYNDFIVHAPWYFGSQGRAYLYFGGPGLDNNADLIFDNPITYGEFGATSNASFRGQDFNGDGYNDIIIAIYKGDMGGWDSGGGWLYFGGPGLDTTPDVTIPGEEDLDWLSRGVAIGDMNGDGYEDFGMGAHMPYKPGGKGRAYLYLGGPAVDGTGDLTIDGEAAGDVYGRITGIGDANLDGRPDILVGASRNDEAGTDAGKAYIYLGREWDDLGSSADIELLGEAPGDNFGINPSPLGDIDGDGRPEFAVAAMYSDANGADAGRVYVYSIDPEFTRWGGNVVVHPVDEGTGTDPVTVTFDNVSSSGMTSLEITATGPPAPSLFKVCSNAYYGITTTADYEGTIEVCIDYSGTACEGKKNLKLSHFEEGEWVDRTTSHDPDNNIICCEVDSLSIFSVLVPVDLTLDIKPCSCPNPFNMMWFENMDNGNDNGSIRSKSKKGGVLPVALVGSGDLDVNSVDLSTLYLESAEPLRTDFEDVSRPVESDEECACTVEGPDGILDLTMKFSRMELAELLYPAEHGDVVKLTLTGALLDGTPFEAVDCVTILNKVEEPMMEVASDGEDVKLGPAVPNPFNPSTRISFYLPGERTVTLEIFDSSGRSIIRMMDVTRMTPGWHNVEWHGIDSRGNAVASGIYFYRLRTEDATISKKMILMR